MPDHSTYDYAVIRVVPRVERVEFVNVGVVVSCPDRVFLDARIELDPVRIAALDATLDIESIRAHLETALAELNEPYRSIVVMREVQGLAYDEIAAAMNMPLGTIKVYLHRARRQLRESMRAELE